MTSDLPLALGTNLPTLLCAQITATMADPFVGLELMHVAHREALQRPADAAVLFVHWTLASSGLQAEHPTQVSPPSPGFRRGSAEHGSSA